MKLIMNNEMLKIIILIIKLSFILIRMNYCILIKIIHKFIKLYKDLEISGKCAGDFLRLLLI